MTDLDYNSDRTIDTIGDATNEAKGQSFDLNMQSEWYKAGATKVSFLGGYRYDEYDFVAYDPRTLFWDEAIDTSQYPLLYDGVGITYNTKYSMPYIGGVMKYEKGKFELGLTAKYSPIASVEDEDDHKMRYKLNTSEADGSMVIASLKANYNINDSWSLFLEGQTTKSDTMEGTQNQYWYDGEWKGWEYEDINYTNEVNLTQIDLGVKDNFQNFENGKSNHKKPGF